MSPEPVCRACLSGLLIVAIVGPLAVPNASRMWRSAVTQPNFEGEFMILNMLSQSVQHSIEEEELVEMADATQSGEAGV